MTRPRRFAASCRARLAAAAASLFLLASADPPAAAQEPRAGALAIPLTVAEPAGAGRRREPVTSGIPLPAGVSATAWSLWDGSRELPVQVTPLQGRTPWILLDFQVDVPARGSRTLTLRSEPPSAAPEAPVSRGDAEADRLTTTQVVDAGSGQTIAGTPARAAWEYRGPLRATRRIDGRYGDLAEYTTRVTFYAGDRQVRIDHTLRNSLRGNERHVKLRSATVRVGSGAARVRAERSGGVSVGPRDVTFEVIPPAYPSMPGLPPDLRRPGALEVDPNGGMVIPDLSHHGASIVLDGEAAAVRSPLFAMAPPAWYAEHGHLGSDRWSTLEDEKAAYRLWGWAWTPRQEPTWPHHPEYFVNWSHVDVHGESESDDLWQNLLMYLRTGIRGYLDRASGWARYYKWEMSWRTDGFDYAWDHSAEGEERLVRRPRLEVPLTRLDQVYLGSTRAGRANARIWAMSHLWGAGLLDWYLLTGDRDAIDAAVDLVEISERFFGWRDPAGWDIGATGRKGARNLYVAIRVWEVTQEPRWQRFVERLVDGYLRSPAWDPRGAYLVPWRSLPGFTVLNPHHFANVNQALDRYYQITRAPALRARLVGMAEFAREYALHPTWLFSAPEVALGPRGARWYGGLDGVPAATARVNPYHTIVWIDTLVRGWRLTGDPSFLERARFHWARGSKAAFGQPLARPPFADGRRVGVFLNSDPSRLYFESHGRLQFVHLLFGDYVRANLPREPEPSVSLAVSPARAPFGTPVTLSWTARGARTCRAGHGWSGEKGTEGREQVGPLLTDRAFVLTCTDGGARIDTAVVQVPVGAAPARAAGREAVVYYPFDDGEVDRGLPDQVTAVDRSGHGRNAAVHGAARAPGAAGEGLSFRGAGDYARSTGPVTYGPEFTVAFWFRIDQDAGAGVHTLFNHGRPGYPESLTVLVSGSRSAEAPPGQLLTFLQTGRKPPAPLTVPAEGATDGAWHHYALTVRGGDATVFVDGSPRATGRLDGARFGRNRSIYLGSQMTLKPGRFLSGGLDELRIHDRALAPDDVRALATRPP